MISSGIRQKHVLISQQDVRRLKVWRRQLRRNILRPMSNFALNATSAAKKSQVVIILHVRVTLAAITFARAYLCHYLQVPNVATSTVGSALWIMLRCAGMVTLDIETTVVITATICQLSLVSNHWSQQRSGDGHTGNSGTTSCGPLDRSCRRLGYPGSSDGGLRCRGSGDY